MTTRFTGLKSTLASASLLALAACGGGGGDDAPPTRSLSTTVIDGAIGNALVCVDRNANNVCEAEETQGRTDADGKVTLTVPNADAGYPLVAMVGTDAVDKDHGPVAIAYVMSAPGDHTAVISPLTTLVQQTIASSGTGSANAARVVAEITGLQGSLFQDYTMLAAPTDGSLSPATLARMVVVTMQQQAAALAPALGTTAIDGATITQLDLDRIVQAKLLELLPSIVTAAVDPAVRTAATPADAEAAIATAVTALVASEGTSAAAAATVVAINNQVPAPVAAASAAASMQLVSLNFTSGTSYALRALTSTAAQGTPDADNKVRYVDRRQRMVAGQLATWGSGIDPWRNADLNWNGTAWVACPIDFESESSVRDALGASTYSYCDLRETGRSLRVSFDVGGKSMSEVYAQIRSAGYTNLAIADTSTLGSAVFPAGSSVFYTTNTAVNTAISYYPSGTDNPPGLGNTVMQYSAAVASGGDATTQPAGTGCRSPDASTNGLPAPTLEAMIATRGGSPCVYAQSSFVYGGVTYTSDTPNEWWSNSTLSLGKLGTAPVNSGPAPGFYTGNTSLRVAFKGTGTNPVTYYACKEVFNTGSGRNCSAIGTGSYVIETLGDGRALSFTNVPPQTAGLNYTRVFVERGGAVYYGFRSKPLTTTSARRNTTAAAALLTQLGVAVPDPSTPVALTATSYQGTWDLREPGTVPSATDGTTVFVNANGSVSCQDRATSQFEACTLTFTDLATGAFNYTNGASTATGTMDFTTGTASGTFSDPTSTPATGSFIGARR